MAFGDIHYKYISSGSTATSATGEHTLIPAANLPNLADREVIHMQAYALGDTAMIGPEGVVTNDAGFRLLPAASMVDFPPMLKSHIAELRVVRAAATNVTVYWTLWRRALGS